MQKLFISLALTFVLSACSFPGVYKIDIPQGNIVTQDMLNKLRPGMTQSQVQYVLGSPLMTDTFSPNRWDYLYSMQKGGEERTQQRIAVFFEDGQLTRITGDLRPTP